MAGLFYFYTHNDQTNGTYQMNNRKSILTGSFWAGIRYVMVFVKSILLLPLILTYCDNDFYTSWILLAAANGLLLGVYDGYIRYVTNNYNLHFHQEIEKATRILGSGIRLATVLSVLFCALLAIVLYSFKPATAWVFHDVEGSYLSTALLVFIIGNVVMNLLRFFYAVNEPLGKMWQNLRFEVVYSAVELLVLFVSIIFIHDFAWVVILNSAVYVLSAVVYLLVLLQQYPDVLKIAVNGTLKEGAQQLKRSLSFIANNFIERLATDSYALLLSWFYYPAAVIRQLASIRTMTNAGISGINIFQAVVAPRIQEVHAKGNNRGLLKLLRYVWLAIAAVMGTALILFYPYLEKVYLIWSRNKIEWNAYAFAGLFICLLLMLYGNTLVFYLKMVNKTKQVLALTIVKICLLLLLLLVLKPGIYSSIIALGASELVTGILICPFIITAGWREKGISFLSFLPSLISFLLIIAAIVWYMIVGYSLLVAVVAYGCLLWLLLVLYRRWK